MAKVYVTYELAREYSDSDTKPTKLDWTNGSRALVSSFFEEKKSKWYLKFQNFFGKTLWMSITMRSTIVQKTNPNFVF